MANDEIVVGDTYATLTINIKDQDGVVVDLTDATSVELISRHVSGGGNTDTKAMTIDDAVNGVVIVKVDTDIIQLNDNEIKVKITWSSGEISYTKTDYIIRGLRL